MALDVGRLAEHLNMTPDETSVVGSEFLHGLLAASTAHTQAQLGFKIDDPAEFPDGTPADVEQAVLMLAAHWFAQREASTVVAMIPVPFGYDEVIRSHRRWTFG